MQIRQDKIIGKTQIRQDKIIENQSQSGKMMIKNTQNKKESSKHKSMLSIYKKNIIETHSQSGRSMIEMLGVLAIIAILSIGGIVGFRLAMNYYRASQIAHEMNMMRTDAQIKIAQGTEELMLGEPYDPVNDSLGHIQFNDAYLVDFDCIYMKTEISEPEPAFCTGANAYYIELQNIPEGVCKPLANLIDKMDNEIAFYINGNSVDAEEGEKGVCNAEFNTLRVIFGADSDSNAIKCGGADDPACPTELPVCLNHMCVECEESNDCGEFEVCDRETGRCIDDCTKGACNSGVCVGGVCKECKNMEDCDNGLACIDNQCMRCENESDCEEKHCIEGSCVDCTEPTPKYNATENRCVECIDSEDCENPKPYCNPTTNTCEPCENDLQCDTTQNEHCQVSTGSCIICDVYTEVWDEELKDCRLAKSCKELDCPIDTFCLSGKCNAPCPTDEVITIEEEVCNSFFCRPTNIGFVQGQVNGRSYYGNRYSLNWWSSQRFCQAAAREAGVTSGRLVSWSDINWQCYNDANKPDPTNKKDGYCKATNDDSGSDNVSKAITDLRNMYQCTSQCFPWLQEAYSSCRAYDVNLFDGYVRPYSFGGNGSYADYALCVGN